MPTSTIIVTGARGFLGSQVARVLAAEGHKVAGIDRSPIPPDAALALALGEVDLGDEASTDGAVAAVARELGPIGALINVAGGFRWETIADGKLATWDMLYQVNVRTALIASRAALPHFAEAGGAIVNIGANAAIKAGLGMGAYAASKAGVARLTEALAEELKDRRIRVNAVLPSTLDTPLNRAEMPTAAFDRWVTPESLAGVVAFLISPAAADITGALIPVTGRV